MQSLFWAVEQPKYPPTLPIPGQSAIKEKDGVQVGPESRLPSSEKSTFSAFCEFWAIAAEVSVVYRDDQGHNKASLAFALGKFQKLLSWADVLPQLMARNNTTPGHVLVFQ